MYQLRQRSLYKISLPDFHTATDLIALLCRMCFIYFADPYSSWQRGSNENANGPLRKFFPKGHDFAKVPEEELAKAIRLINQSSP